MSKNNDKKQLSIDVISRIDDKIIKDATAERIKMLRRVERASSPLVKFLKYGSAVAAVMVVILGVMLAVLLMNGKQVPVYNGMSVSGEMPIYSGAKEGAEASIPTFLPTLDITNYRNGQLARSMKTFVGIGRLDKGGIPNANGQGNGRPGQDPDGSVYDSVDMTPGTGEPGVSESVSETEPDDLSPEPVNPIYYAKQNEDFYITVHIDNPDRFEILSFTLNDEKYSSYMFEEGSDLEHLVLKCNVENAEGIVEYTIDAIKYVDGTAIKDVKIKGDRTVKIGVWTSDQPYVVFNEKNWLSHSLVLDIKIKDNKGMLTLSDGRVYAYLYNGYDEANASAEFVELDPSTPNRIVFHSIEPEKNYRLEIRARYDAFDGNGVSDYVLYSEVGTTVSPLVVEKARTENYGEVKFSLTWAEDTTERKITSAELLLGEEVIKTLDVSDDATEITESGLLSNTTYTLRLKYSCNGQEYSLETSTKTLIKQAPSIKLGNVKRDRNSILGSVELNDPLGLASAFRIELWLGDELITTVNDTGGFVFDGLAIEKGYTVEYIVEYDADDGKGTVTNTTTRKYWYESEGLAYDTSGRISGIGTCTDTVLYLDREIYREAFAGNSRITKVYISENVKSVGSRAFKDCKSLTEVVLPDEMESLGAHTFEGCPISEFNIPKLKSSFVISVINNTNVKVLAIPEGVTVSGALSVYSDAEYDELARKLTLISFGSAELFVDVRVYYDINNPDLYGTWQLKAINVAGAKDMAWEDGTLYAIYENGERVLIKAQDGTGTFRVPEGVIKICDNAFSYMRYNTVTLPSTLTDIGAFAFSSSALTEVIIPDGVTSIGENAFAECRSLQKVTIGEGLRKLDNATFNCCEKLCEISLPETLTSIGVVALNECHSLKLIVIPAGVTSIGEKGVVGCGFGTIVCFKSSELPNIVRPQDYENIKFITDFKEFITDEQGVTYAVTNGGEMTAISYSGTGASVVLPEGVVEIGANCFKENKKLVSITLPSTLRVIGGGAFGGCDKLARIDLPEGLTTIGEYAFQDCSAIEKLIVPEGTTKVGYGAFWGVQMVYFQADTLPEGLDPNEPNYVIGCKEIVTDEQGVTYAVNKNGEMTAISYNGTGTSVVLPEGVVEIVANCFNNSVKLRSVVLPSTLKTIGTAAFRNCSALKEIEIPEGITVIPIDAFNSCGDLRRVKLPSTLKCIERDAFGWCGSLDDIEFPDGLEEIGDNAFVECRALRYTIIPTSVKIIDNGTFSSCYGITILCPTPVPPPGWKTGYWAGRLVLDAIGYEIDEQKIVYAIHTNGTKTVLKCEGEVTDVVIPEGVVAIEKWSFDWCDHIKSIHLPGTLEYLNDNALNNCGVQEIFVPKSVKEVGEQAFGTIPLIKFEASTLPSGMYESDYPGTVFVFNATR